MYSRSDGAPPTNTPPCGGNTKLRTVRPSVPGKHSQCPPRARARQVTGRTAGMRIRAHRRLDMVLLLIGALLVGGAAAIGAVAGDGERMIAPLRAVAPAILDTVADMPYTEVASIHNEPTDPLPYYERSIMLREFPAERARDIWTTGSPSPRSPHPVPTATRSDAVVVYTGSLCAALDVAALGF